MTDTSGGKGPLSESELQELVSSTDGGARSPSGGVGLFLAVVAIVWSLFQVLLASPISNYVLPGDLINNSRQIHLAFAIFLAFMAYPMFKSSPRSYVPVYDWVLALAGTFISLYGYFFYQKIVDNGGLADHMDKWFALAGLIILFEGARRAWPGHGDYRHDLSGICVFWRVLVDSRGDPLEGRKPAKGHEPYVDHLRRGVWHRAWRFYEIRIPVRAVRRSFG